MEPTLFNTAVAKAGAGAPPAPLRETAGGEDEALREHAAELTAVRAALDRESAERSRGEAALCVAREQLEALLANIPDLAWMKGADHRVLAVSQALADAAGVPREECVGKTDFDLWPRDLAEKIRADDERVLREQTALVTEESYLAVDGTRHWVETVKRPVRDQEGRIVGTVGVARDITPRKQAEEALRRSKEAAEEANRAKSEFLSGMSHELRTPLNSILGFAQLLAMGELSPDQARAVERISRAGDHLLGLISEVLDLARIEADRETLSLEPVRVASLLREALELVRPIAGQFDRALSEEIPVQADCYVRADRQRLTQVLLNLLTNAIKYNRPGGSVRFLCGVQAGADGASRVSIGVRDTGPGIAPDRIGELFTPFARLGAEHSGVEGTGLGLSLSRRLVEAMGGSIRVDSRVGAGSTFWVELPHASAPVERVRAARSGASLAPDLSRQGPSTILYVEDDLANLDLVESIFAPFPAIRLIPALQGQLGLELAREHRPDLVLLDLHLPDIQGEAVLRMLREDPRTAEIPVVVISADATVGRIRRLRAAGAQEYLTKPLDVEHFLATVQRLLPPVPEDGPARPEARPPDADVRVPSPAGRSA